ncbi:uncharacterized protein LOC118769641 [Megalops cyprinoides]|uniref:uncharacterized protein LOC118769641 n=1 Tax=Megalops cyprinoides TaxID=118141 RepID=UPI001864EB7A|nr:uncharacterized protein LOC118769641 [Megalops cyprinoides]
MMLRHAGYVIGAVLLLASYSSAFTVRKVNVASSITLPCSGADFDQWRILGNENNEEQLVASLNKSKVNAGPGFEGRITFTDLEKDPENLSLTISPVKYTDKGVYQCWSNSGEILTDVRLEVLVPRMHSVPQGEPLTLHCYVDISRHMRYKDLDFTWYKDGQLVCRVHGGDITYGPGFEDKVILSPSRTLDGDMALTLHQVHPSDQGEYWCTSNEPERKGNPDSHSVTVTVPPKDSRLSGGAVAGIVAVVLGVPGAAALVWCIWKKKESCCHKTEASEKISYSQVNGEDTVNKSCTNDQPPEANTPTPEPETQPQATHAQPPEAESQPPAPEPQPQEEVVRISVPETQPVGEKLSPQPWSWQKGVPALQHSAATAGE